MRVIAAFNARNQAAQQRARNNMYKEQLWAQRIERQQVYYPLRSVNRTNGTAIRALVASFFISVLGIILGHIVLGQIKHTGEGGRGLAIAALVIGYSELILGLILTVILVSISSVYVR